MGHRCPAAYLVTAIKTGIDQGHIHPGQCFFGIKPLVPGINVRQIEQAAVGAR